MKISIKLGVLAVLAMTVISAKAWIRSDIDNYSATGLNERYVFGGGCGWWQNDSWDSACSGCVNQQAGTEGSDCSDYVPRCYALPSYKCTRSCTGHPYSTFSMYNGWSGVNLISNGAKYTWMHFVTSGCGSDHTGLVRTWDATYCYSRDAHCTTCGIEACTRTWSYLSSVCAHYLLRSNL